MTKKDTTKKKKISLIALCLSLMLLSLPLVSCDANDPLTEPLYTDDLYVTGALAVGTTRSLVDAKPGTGYFNSKLAVRAEPYGLGFSAIGAIGDAVRRNGTCDFDLTGGSYENLLTAGSPVFLATDANGASIITITEGECKGATAEISRYIDSSNVTLSTITWDFDLSDIGFTITPHPVFYTTYDAAVHMDVRGTGEVIIHSSNYTEPSLLTSALDAGADDVINLGIRTNANGYDQVKALNVRYRTGDMQPGDSASVARISMVTSGAVSANETTEVDMLSFETTNEVDLQKHAIHIGTGFDIALAVSGGTIEDPDYGYEVAPDVPVDRVNGAPQDGTAFLSSSTADLAIFDNDDDYVLIGSDATFTGVEVILSSGSNVPILADYYYSTGAGTWDTLSVSDTTDDWQETGILTFVPPDDWAKTNLTVPAGAALSNAYYIKVVRTRNNVGTPPVEDYFKTYENSALSDLEIRGDGTIRPVEMANASAPNNSLYYSTDSNKLVYKDSGGTVHELW